MESSVENYMFYLLEELEEEDKYNVQWSFI